MKTTERWIVTLLMLLGMVAALPQAKAWPKPPVSLETTAALQAKILKSILPGATLAQIRKLFPAGVVLTGSEWRGGLSGYGNYFFLSGVQSGNLSFIDRKVATRGPSYPYSPEHSINTVDIVTPITFKRQSVERQYILFLNKYLGQPNKVWLQQDAKEVSYWAAVWKLRGDRTVYFNRYWDQSLGQFSDKKMGLSMEFSYSFKGDE